MKTRTFLSILALPVALFSCTTLSKDHIQTHQWFHGDGANIGDHIEFDKNYSIREDTILKKELPVAVLVYSSGDLIGNNNSVTIQSLATGEEGTYHEQ